MRLGFLRIRYRRFYVDKWNYHFHFKACTFDLPLKILGTFYSKRILPVFHRNFPDSHARDSFAFPFDRPPDAYRGYRTRYRVRGKTKLLARERVSRCNIEPGVQQGKGLITRVPVVINVLGPTRVIPGLSSISRGNAGIIIGRTSPADD